MENLELFRKNEGLPLFIIKKNKFNYYVSVLAVVISVLFVLRFLYLWIILNEGADVGYLDRFLTLSLIFSLPLLLYDKYYKSQEDQYLMVNSGLFFLCKKANTREVTLIDFKDYGIIFITLKDNNEVVLLSERKLPWGNRKMIISNEFINRKKELLKLVDNCS